MLHLEIPEHLRGEQWRRIPKPKDRLYGLSRTTLLELINAGHIRSVVIRKPGAIRGIRLIFMPSLAEFLDNLKEKVARAEDSSVGVMGGHGNGKEPRMSVLSFFTGSVLSVLF
jgi:hypothetical protein